LVGSHKRESFKTIVASLTGHMPFLLSNKQCQSTDLKITLLLTDCREGTPVH